MERSSRKKGRNSAASVCEKPNSTMIETQQADDGCKNAEVLAAPKSTTESPKLDSTTLDSVNEGNSVREGKSSSPPAGEGASTPDTSDIAPDSVSRASSGVSNSSTSVRAKKVSAVTYEAASDLAHDDDILCDVFVDTALGFQTHKMALSYARIDFDVIKLEEVMLEMGCDHDVSRAFTRIFGNSDTAVIQRDSLTDVQRCRLDTPQFEEHAKRYLRMFLPHSGYSILPDTRYSGDRVDGRCTYATRKLSKPAYTV